MKKIITWLVAALVIGAMLLGDFAFTEVAAQEAFGQPVVTGERVHVAQFRKKKRRTLMDMLFGNDDEEEAPPPPVEQPKVVRQPRKKAALPPPPKPTVEKAQNATRLAVFGDSLAADLAKALERLYGEDPNLIVINQAVGSSGFVREDHFNWDKTIGEEISKNSFDIAVMIIGVNDRQTMRSDGESLKSLTPEWSAIYRARVADFVTQLRKAGKPIIWVGLPPMAKSDYSAALNQITAIQRLAAFSGGAEFLDIYERFVDEEGKYSSYGPDINGNRVRIRKDDGIHFSTAGADKLAFYLSQSLRLYYRGGGAVGLEVQDALLGTEAQNMLRPPYQGLGQIRLLEVAGAVISLTHSPKRATDLVTAESTPATGPGFDMTQLIEAPIGRVDAFGVGKAPGAEPEVAAAP